MPEAPDPETLPTFEERRRSGARRRSRRGAGSWITRDRPIDVRPVVADDPFKPDAAPAAPARLDPRQTARSPTPLLLHQCVVAYASDLTLLDTATLPHAIAWNDPHYVMASLDHAMWFHRPFRADEWLLYAQESPAAHGARGFTRRISSRATGSWS